MDWTHMADHYVQLFGDTAYWIVMVLWLALPYAGVAVLVYAVRVWIQSMQPANKMERELQEMIRQETRNGR